MELQFRLIAIPVNSKAWIARCQIGKHGKKENGNYISHEMIIPDDFAKVILNGNRTFSMRLGSAEIYHSCDNYLDLSNAEEANWLKFGDATYQELSAKDIDAAVRNQAPLFPELEKEVMEELEKQKEIWFTKQIKYEEENSPSGSKTIH